MIVTCSACGWQQAEHSPEDFECLQCGPKIYAPPMPAERSVAATPGGAAIVLAISYVVIFLLGVLVGSR